MKLPYSKLLAFALAGLLSAPISLAWANSPQAGVLQTQPAAPVSDTGYKISRLSHKTDTIDVFYPQLDMSNMVTSVLVNYQLFQVPGEYSAALAPADSLRLDYTVTRQEPDLISVVFRGEQTQDDSSKPLLTTVNYNLKKRVPVTAARLIRNTDEAKQGVTRLLRQAASAASPAIDLPAFSDKTTYYLTGKYVVFYHQPEDSARFVELPVALDLIRPYLSDDYRSLAVTAEVGTDPRQAVADIDKALAGYQAIDGKRSTGSTEVDFTAYFADNVLVYAEEQQTKEYEKSTAKYYFDNGKLIAYKKSAENLIVPLNGVASVQREEATMFYDASLNRSDGELIINGTAAKLPESYSKAAYAVAEEIQKQAATLLAEAEQ